MIEEFDPIGNEEWKKLILKSLKADTDVEKLVLYEQNLIRKIEPGIVIHPFYTKNDLTELSYLKAFHDTWVKLKKTTGWINVQQVEVKDEKAANEIAKNALKKGADGITFLITSDKVSFSILLDTILLTDYPVYFIMNGSIDSFIDHINSTYPDKTILMGGVNYGSDDVENLHKLVSCFAKSPYFKSLTVSVSSFGGYIENIKKLLISVIDKIDILSEKGISILELLNQVAFVVDIQPDYFLEIARLRALRLLWWQIAEFYQPQINLIDVFIHSRTKISNPPENEPYQRLISNTTESMSAIIGGCDALTIFPNDTTGNDGNDFSERVARNVSEILKEESYFDKVTDIGAGSYLIENLTHLISKAVWEQISLTAKTDF